MDTLHGRGEKRKATEFELDACAAIERIVYEARAGHPRRLANLDPLSWELLLLWQRREAEHEAAARASLHDLSATVAALAAGFTQKSD